MQGPGPGRREWFGSAGCALEWRTYQVKKYFHPPEEQSLSTTAKAEEEQTFFEEDRDQPIPPENVVAYNELRSCADLHRMHASGKLEIQPDFQRDIVWKIEEQARFIDSLVKQLPIPSMCFSIKSEVYLSAQQTKGSKGRTLYLSDKMRDEISLYLKTRFKLKDLLPVTMTDTVRALFTNQKDCQRGFSASTACQMFHYWYKEAKIEGASSHSGRRGFITNLANKGVHVRILQELAGHSSIAVTQKYIDVNQDKLRIAVEML